MTPRTLSHHAARDRAAAFCADYGLEAPILLAPMAGACPPALSAAVAQAGGMGGCGALMLSPAQITEWVAAFRARSNGGVQVNLWVPDPPPARDPAAEAAMLDLLARHGPPVPPAALDGPLVADFDAQCEALLAAAPRVVGSIMGLFPPAFVAALKARGIAWFATATTLAEARAAEAAGADAVIAQGFEAGGHRGAFDAARAEAQLTGSLSLIPAFADALSVPVIATGGIADGRQLAAALTLGASAAQVGTAFLRAPEAAIAPAWAEAIGRATPDSTVATRGFSGRLGRGLRNAWTEALAEPGAPAPLPYPLQRAATGPMREAAAKAGDAGHLQMWAGQSAGLARPEPAAAIVRRLWGEAQGLLP